MLNNNATTMINSSTTNNNNSTSFCSSSSTFLFPGDDAAGFFTFRRIFLLQEVQILEIFLALSVFIAIHSLRQKKNQGLPIWPFVGMLPSLLPAIRGNTYEWLSDVLCNQNGTFRFKGPVFSSLNCVITADPRNLEHLLKTKFSNFPKGHYFRDNLRDLLGEGIFNADDEVWQKQRKTASIEFHSAKFRQLTIESLLELVHSRLLLVLENAVENSISIDLQDILLRLTFDNVCMIAFGVDPGCLNPGLPEIPFAKAFEDATEATVLRFVSPTCLWKTMRFLNLGTEKKLKRSIKGVDEFAEEVIRKRKKELGLQVDDDKKQRSDLLTIFMRLKDEQGRPFSDKFLRDICVNFILAGRDTSSVALSWFFWLIDQNPHVEEKILAEMCRILRERKDFGNGESDNPLVFKPQEIKKMEYLQAAISEGLRLYPSVPVDHKEVVEDEIFPDGTVLKKGTKVIYAIYAMARMEAIWGNDCREYRPERWLRVDGRFMSESAYKFTAFNGGPRLCLGKDFAYYQMKFAAASILYRYHVQVVKGHPVVPKLALTMYMKHGLKVNLIKRDEFELHKYLKMNY
ncbi:Cytochrome P450 family 86 subfamily B polypeptide 1 isoform 1 [Tripterygium wilfordii]|uniref:Cytochrome P450 family 86 subfamily B polypeptide 1 isoform 1 n=1 Tax=Tripterygium wilfordii TaxID=458696 RepID=A0A7J7CUX4_TRIWF|nr:cytochrome P450 86B1-like [Tripterygium wilfordii]KAF5737935.1 Cytochrome P450 family 86 subfamily B polypeptide 1 isoform 1 [Tripterygium wilfordii]